MEVLFWMVLWLIVVIGLPILNNEHLRFEFERFFSQIFYWTCGFAIARWLTPAGHRRFGDYKGSDGFAVLAKEAYRVTASWASDAVLRAEGGDDKAQASGLTALKLK
jgi:hypothetical protein